MDNLNTYNIEAEESVIGAILVEPDLIKELTLKPQHFTPGQRSNLVATMIDLDAKGKTVEPLSVVERLGTHNLDKIGGLAYITELGAGVPTTLHFKQHQELVMESYKRREASAIGRKLAGGEVEMNEAADALTKLQDDGEADDDGTIGGALLDLYDTLENATGEVTGIRSGFRDLDRITGGAQGGQLIVVGARPSVGKTAFALNIGINAAEKAGEKGDVVAIFSYEMGKAELLKRMAASVGNLDLQKMKQAARLFTGAEWVKLSNALNILSGADLHVYDDANMTVNYIWNKVRKLKRKHPGRRILVIIDYLQLVIPPSHLKGNRTQEISDISQSLKRLARAEEVPVIALSQLSRSVEQRQDKRPMLSDLRESGSIEQDADIVSFLYRDDYYDKESEEQNIVEIIVAKHRDGPTGSVKLAFIKEYGKMLSIDWNQPDNNAEKKGWSE